MIISGSLLAEDDRDGRCGHRVRVAVRGHERSTRSTSRGWRRCTKRRRCRSPDRVSRSAPRPTARASSTASGVPVQSGVAAADPELLPVGSVIEVDSLPAEVQRHLHRDGHRARPCRAVRSTSTCGTATRRCSSAASRCTSPCCASAGTRARRRRASSIASSRRANRPPLPVPSAAARRPVRRIEILGLIRTKTINAERASNATLKGSRYITLNSASKPTAKSGIRRHVAESEALLPFTL